MDRIRKLSEEYRDFTADVLSQMVKTSSLSGDEEEVIKLIKGILDKEGIETRIDGLGNLIATVGSGRKILAIDAHIDVVDTGDPQQWSFPPFSGEIKDGFVLGRGSADQKGGAASMVTAAKILKEVGYSGEFNVMFTFTVQEEDCDGMCWLWLIEKEGIKPDFCILTEPTNLRLHRGHRGRMEIELYFKGLSAHGSMPERGVNAIERASRAVLEIIKLNENLKTHDFLGKGTIAPTLIESESPSLCAIPDRCRVHIDRRLTLGETKETVIQELKSIVPEDTEIIIPVYKKKGWKGNVYEQEKYFPTWILEESHPLLNAGKETFVSLFGEEPEVSRWIFSTNGVAIAGRHGVPCLGFGPGDERLAHAPDEKVPVEHLVRASAFYALIPYVLEKHTKGG